MRGARRIPSPTLLLGGSIATGLAVVAGLQALDRTAVRIVDQLRHPLQTSLSASLGHPIALGDYRGLRPWGVALGPTHVPATDLDRSSLRLDELQIRFSPLASLHQWRPVVELRLNGVQALLHRQENGQYWRFGSPAPSREPLPDVDLRFVLPRPAQIELASSGDRLLLEGQGSVLLQQARFRGGARLRWTDRKGRLSTEFKGRWNQPELALRTRLQALELSRLARLLPLPAGVQLDGRAEGNLGLHWRPGDVGCHGSLRLQELVVEGGGLPDPLRSSAIGVRCDQNRLVLANSQISSGPWRARAAGAVELNRSFDLSVVLAATGREESLTLALDGPWGNPRWRLDGRLALPQLAGPLQLNAELRTPWRDPDQRAIRVRDALLEAPGLRLRLAGVLGADSDLRSRELTLSAPLWQAWPGLGQLLGKAAPLEGELRLQGPLNSPTLALQLGQARNLLLETWDLRASWSQADGLAKVERFESPLLQASAALPLRWRDGAMRAGELRSDVSLQTFPLARLSTLLGMPVAGQLSASGTVAGPLSALRPALMLDLTRPGLGPLRFPEHWQGQLSGQLGQGLELAMNSQTGTTDGALRLQGAGRPLFLELMRGDGTLALQRQGADQLRWTADRLVLDGLQFSMPFTGQWQAMRGRLSGQGQSAGPGDRLTGSIQIDSPALQGLSVRQIDLEGELNGERFDLTTRVVPEQGEVNFSGSGRLNAAVRARLEAKGLDVPWLLLAARQLRGGGSEGGFAFGQAADLGRLLINTFGGSLDGHLRALKTARQELAIHQQMNPPPVLDPDDLQGRVDAVIDLSGPQLSALTLQGEARAHLWVDGGDRDRMLQMEPVVARVEGPLQGGAGSFSLLHLPFTLLGLVAPVPSALRGAIGLTGRYDLSANDPLVTAELVLEAVQVGCTSVVLERRSLELTPEGLRLDLAIRAAGAAESIQLHGLVPVSLLEPLDLVVEAHGDSLRFLAPLASSDLRIDRGSTDLRLLLRGVLEQPEANGFLLVRDGAFQLGGQSFQAVHASMLFDFNRLEVNQLEATLGSGGQLSARGAIGLFRSSDEASPLAIRLVNGRIRQSIVDVAADGEVVVLGALNQPELTGQLTLSRGLIQPRTGLLTRFRMGLNPAVKPGLQASPLTSSVFPVDVPALVEDSWDFQDPLVLFGPGAERPSLSSIGPWAPALPAISFRNFRLGLGPNLQMQMPPLISFSGGGQLLLNGPLDPSLQVRGLVRLNRGRVSLFSTTFRLDGQAPNVAVFSPSLGLVPFVDIAMRSRVSDSVQQGGDGSATTTNIFETNGLGLTDAGVGRLRLVKVTVLASGSADRLAENLKLRSSPPMSQSQLLSLIGGNSLSGLAGAGGTALATVVGQSLLSPVLGTLTDVMGQRMQIALFPTYITPEVKDASERTSGRVAPTFTLVTELGIDVTDRFDFSVLAAPNTTDVPPQATVTYRVTPSTSLSGSMDANGTWQSQLQLFLRF